MTMHACLVGTDEVFRAGLESILKSDEFEIVGSFEGTSEIEGENLPSEFLAVVDLPDAERQIEAIKALKSLYPSSYVVMISNEFEINSMMQCFGQGAHGFLVKSLNSRALIVSLHLAALGEKVLPSNVANELFRGSMNAPSVTETENAIKTADLSPREYDVLNCLMAGDPNKVIARQLDLCEATVKVHVKAILRKLCVRNRTQAAIWARSHGIHTTNEISALS